MITPNYNPDVLSCLANLSNDEVFTPPTVVNQMLDMLPTELWSNPKATFLDPVSKTGVFLREITKRLMSGLAEQIPDEQERANHILTQQVFGLAITELTALLSRRSLYCSKFANGKYSICTAFTNEAGNVRFTPTAHTWVNKRCKYCGASQEVFDRGDALESHAYEFIHTDNPNQLVKNMKFDVIIGNPPYQLNDGSGGSTDSAMPIYNKFIEQAIKLSPRYLCMIIPSKWMVGGRGLQTFRKEMMSDTRLEYIYDFEDASACFQGLHIDGGVCYFLWNKDYNGKTNFVYTTHEGNIVKGKHYLKNSYFDYVIRDNRILSILEKCSKEKSFNTIVSNVKPFGIRGYLFNEPQRYPTSNLQYEPFYNSVKVYGVKGLKGGAKRVIGYVSPQIITSNIDCVDKYKLFFTTSYSTGAINPPETIKGERNSICTETFLLIGPFDSREEQESCFSYINTAFFKFLLYHGKGTMHVNRAVFSLIPLQDFSHAWTDEQLYAKYNLTEEEIAFIESMIRPME